MSGIQQREFHIFISATKKKKKKSSAISTHTHRKVTTIFSTGGGGERPATGCYCLFPFRPHVTARGFPLFTYISLRNRWRFKITVPHRFYYAPRARHTHTPLIVIGRNHERARLITRAGGVRWSSDRVHPLFDTYRRTTVFPQAGRHENLCDIFYHNISFFLFTRSRK